MAGKRKGKVLKKEESRPTPQPKTEMDKKIEAAMGQIVDETLKNQDEWKENYKKEDNKPKKKVKKSVKKNTKKKKVSSKSVFMGVGVAVIVLGVVYGGGVYYYKDKFFAGTRINGVACGNMTAKEAEKAVKEAAEKYSLELTFKDKKKEKINGSDIKYTYSSDGKAAQLLEEQKPVSWLKGLFKKTEYTLDGKVQYDETLLNEKLDSFAAMKEENMVQPVDAQIAFEKNQFVIKEETTGTAIDKELFRNEVKKALEKSNPKISAEKTGAYVLPAITKEDETLKHQQEVWNGCAAVTVTYTIGENTEVLDGMTVKDWMTYDEAGNYVENQAVLEENIRSYVAELSSKYDTAGKTRTIISTATGQPVTVQGGSYGFVIDGKAEREQLLADIQAHAETKREPIYARRAKNYGENDIGDTYIEVDLTAQHLWYYKEGKLLLDSSFVSGTYHNKSRRTPAGSYYLYYKQRDTVLRPAPNRDGSYAYQTPVKYWMPFNGGIGFHDADWRGRFGGTIYLYSGSHGCINLPVSFAGQLYENIEADCPVICFYR